MKLISNFFRLKYESSIYNIGLYKVILSESGVKYAEINHNLQAKTVQNKYVCGFWFEMATLDGIFFSGGSNEALLLIMESFFGQKRWFKIKMH